MQNVKNLLLAGLCALLTMPMLSAQTPGDTIARLFRATEQSLVLLRNEGGLLPLQRLDSLRVAYYDLNDQKGSALEKTLAKYTVLETPALPEGLSAGDAALWADQQARLYDVCVVALRDVAGFSASGAGASSAGSVSAARSLASWWRSWKMWPAMLRCPAT
ncbi:MAG TPA: hypothetical protein PLL53_08350 [Saprospiraceae bacterium]|nr:hypothetical protein [Saprospiraceae bacterium]